MKRGRNVGIFRTWTECKKQVNHYSNARFKSFASMSDAMAFMGWKRAKGELKNKELWQQIDQNLQQLSNYNFIWTKGHYGNKGNEFVDQYLNKCMDEILL